MTLRVVIADDQEMVRSGFRLILESHGIEVVGAAGDGRTAVRMALALRPDVCLLDIRMPELDGLEATRQLAGRDVDQPVPVVVVTTFDLDEYVLAAAAGDALVSPSITVRLLEHYAGADPAPQPATPLTKREEEVLGAVARGRTNAEIGEELFISLSTVKSHMASVQAKLHARNRVELASWAWMSGRMR